MSRANPASIATFLLLALTLTVTSKAHAEDFERPFIWVKASERPDILQKIANNPWANELFQTLQTSAEAATSDSIFERREKLMALPLVWPRERETAPTNQLLNRLKD